MRANLRVALVLLIAQSLPARAQQEGPLRAVLVSPGVWALVGPIGGPSRDNHALNATYGVIATLKGTVLIDSGAAAQGAWDSLRYVLRNCATFQPAEPLL